MVIFLGFLRERPGFWCSHKLGLSTCPQHDWTKAIVKSRERFIQYGHTGKSRSWGPDPTPKPIFTLKPVFSALTWGFGLSWAQRLCIIQQPWVWCGFTYHCLSLWSVRWSELWEIPSWEVRSPSVAPGPQLFLSPVEDSLGADFIALGFGYFEVWWLKGGPCVSLDYLFPARTARMWLIIVSKGKLTKEDAFSNKGRGSGGGVEGRSKTQTLKEIE